MFDSAGLQAFGEAVVFFASDIAVSFVEEFDGLVQTARPVEMGVDREVVVDIFSIFDRGFLDFKDSSVDFFNGFAFLFLAFAAAGTLEMGTCAREDRTGRASMRDARGRQRGLRSRSYTQVQTALPRAQQLQTL